MDCLSESRNCYQSCILPYTGVIDENVLDLVFDVASDLDCRSRCLAIRDCSHFTFFNDKGQCFLLSELLEPVEPCDNCVTGPDICTDADHCLNLHNGALQKSEMFTDTENTINVTLLADDHCEARMFLVGGGGKKGVGTVSGAGSGYLKYKSISLTETKSILLNIGDHEEASYVNIDGVTIEALPGESDTSDGSIRYGGKGYSGGGGWNCSCNGGSDGSDGAGDEENNHFGGHGTGEKLSSFPLNSFILTPGVGGQHYSGHGGGGGGVLVDGAGPSEWDNTQGEGYGGGGCRDNSLGDYVSIGLRGVILMEMVP